MDVTPAIAKSLPVIKAYGNGGFRVGEMSYAGCIRITLAGVQAWIASDNDSLQAADFDWILEVSPKPEVLIIGTGKLHRMLPAEIRALLKSHGISVDAMDTGAACRTYNVLATEGRRVAAALIAVP